MSIKTGLEYVGYIDPWTDEERLSDEEIVRCRDCKHFEQGYTDGVMFDETVCWGWENGHDYPSHTVPDGFCWRGERRDA
jgi:hypothetical protein